MNEFLGAISQSRMGERVPNMSLEKSNKQTNKHQLILSLLSKHAFISLGV